MKKLAGREPAGFTPVEFQASAAVGEGKVKRELPIGLSILLPDWKAS